MIKITLITIGKLKEKYLVSACNEYLKRLSKYSKISVLELSEAKLYEESPVLVKRAVDEESSRILNNIKKDDYVILLELDGKSFSSEEFAAHFASIKDQGQSSFVFVIGGSHGTNKELSNRANLSLKLGDLTFPHQIARLLILEVMYRSFKIINNESYHK